MAAKVRTEQDDNAMIRQRINIGMVPNARNSVTKSLAQKWIALTSAAQGDSLHKTEEAYQAFCSVLASMEVQARKLAAMHAASSKELQSYEHKQQQLQVDIAQARELIDRKKEQLAEARLWRKQQEEYEVLREQIIKLPPRHDTQQAIDAVNQDIASIQAATRQQEVLHEVVSKKAAAVFYHLDDLLSSFPTAESLARDAAGGGGGDAAQAMQVDG